MGGYSKKLGDIEDISGQQFKYFKVLDAYERRTATNGQMWTYWKCRCHCGKIVWVQSAKIKNGRTRSCGCKRVGINSLPGCRSLQNIVFTRYKLGATNRHLEFALSFDEFEVLTIETCIYCGQVPSNVCKQRDKTWTYQGIDRVDNSMGYVQGNCVPCCDICNVAKSNLTRHQFYDWIERVHDRSAGFNLCSLTG